MGFYLRAGLWIDGIEILTSLGRRSGVFGNPLGGSGCVDIFDLESIDRFFFFFFLIYICRVGHDRGYCYF